MHHYRYQPGDRPLDGYTVQAAAGRGGFGEVYYAVSESGREVALKAIDRHTQVELRGIAQCMNLKSPHLVTIFDMRRNEAGEPFVIMEYMHGVSLRQMIDAHPAGLGEAKTAFFLRELVKGLTYLHGCGIIHRDLKPANIFFENGAVKIGDYGLSKAIAADHHASQTVTVGTVHYMAPEIGSGRYGESIDIYALGVMLYEMLTGRLPFEGDSPSEILFKHLSAEPDCQGIDEPFRSVVRKALAKAPAERYATVQQLSDDLFDAQPVQQAVSTLGPQELSVAAERVAAHLRGNSTSGPAIHGTDASPHRGQRMAREVERFIEGERPPAAAGSAPAPPPPPPAPPDKRRHTEEAEGQGEAAGQDAAPARVADPLSYQQRLTLTLITLGIAAGATGLLTGESPGERVAFIAFSFLFGLGATFGLRAAQARLLPTLRHESDLIRRCAAGGTSAALGTLASLLLLPFVPIAGQSTAALALTLLLFDWRQAPDRKQRLDLSDALLPAVAAAIFAGIFGGLPGLAIGTAVGITFAIQTLSPWLPRDGRTGAKADAKARAKAWAAGEGAGSGERPPWPLPDQWPFNPEKQPPFPTGHASPPPPAIAGASPFSRLVALLLAIVPLLVPVCGLHRFYVGKIGTGILWLCTFGLLYVGQIIDVILIAGGAFTDANRRPVMAWSFAPDPATVAAPGAVPPPRSAGPVIAAGLAWIAILGAAALTIATAMGLPGHVAFERGLLSALGYTATVKLLGLAAAGLLGAGGVLLLVARLGQTGTLHTFRALLGLAGLGFILLMIFDTLLHLPPPDRSVVTNVERFLDRADPDVLLVAFISILLLAWPHRRGDVRSRRDVEAES